MRANQIHSSVMSDEQQIGFSTILASTIHEVKNSLGVVLNSLDELLCSNEVTQPVDRLVKLRCEAQRVNDNLVQLLALYKMENQGLALNIDEYFVHDFLEEVLAAEKVVLETRGIELEIRCLNDLAWYFDRELIAGALKNAVNNALRHARSKVLVTAEERDQYLVISVNDDGDGYARGMPTNGLQSGHGVNFSSGNTGLGLYFTSKVAELHKNKDRRGSIELDNGRALGGACFSIKLP